MVNSGVNSHLRRTIRTGTGKVGALMLTRDPVYPRRHPVSDLRLAPTSRDRAPCSFTTTTMPSLAINLQALLRSADEACPKLSVPNLEWVLTGGRPLVSCRLVR